ncbi:MAG TPA: hypothetical protein VK022_06460 [Paracoccaceae bacterium]|nr:hypothetical protein [Paracoccaceae bacterium]
MQTGSRNRPGEDGAPPASATFEHRRRRDAAAVLPFAALVLFVSPLLDLMAGADTLFGIPVGVLYIFGSWFALIAATGLLARRLGDDQER